MHSEIYPGYQDVLIALYSVNNKIFKVLKIQNKNKNLILKCFENLETVFPQVGKLLAILTSERFWLFTTTCSKLFVGFDFAKM